MRHLYSISLIILLAFVSECCNVSSNIRQEEIVIAVSKESQNGSFTNYYNWLNRVDTNIRFVNLYYLGYDSALKVLASCDGLLLTGGEDVFPDYYGKISDTLICGDIDYYRDSIEFESIKIALALKMPIVGVCRGEQILNVSQGGSLIVDIPTQFDTTVIHQQDDWQNCYHKVSIIESTELSRISGCNSGQVTSNHHQGIDRLGKGLKISAYSLDGLAEAIEWDNRENNGFLMAVQWHPERMDTTNVLSLPIAKEFIDEVRLYAEKKK